MNKLYELLNEVSVDLGEYKEQELSELETKRIKKNVLNGIKVRKKQNNTKWTTLVKACACVVLILGAGSAGIAAANGQLPEGTAPGRNKKSVWYPFRKRNSDSR